MVQMFGVIQRRCSLRFALKTSECLRVAGNFFRQKLESNETMKPRVLSLVDDAHAAAAELLDDSIMRDRRIDHIRRTKKDA